MAWIRFVIIAWGFGGLLMSDAWAQPATPYQATIKNSSTVVHAGPSRKMYATEVLDRGSTVEVYRHDPEGWCAIRPPAGSFSLVRLADLEIDSDHSLGIVRRDGVIAWVGTRIHRQGKAIWQIKLSEGERVEVLETESTDSGSSPETWVLIAPPAGEFRWVHETNLHRETGPTDLAFPGAPSLGSLPRELPGILPANSSSESTDSVSPPPPSEFNSSQEVVTVSGTETEGFVSRADDHDAVSQEEPVSLAAQLKQAHQQLSHFLLGSSEQTAVEFQAMLNQLSRHPEAEAVQGHIQQLQQRFDRYLHLELQQQALARLAQAQPKRLPIQLAEQDADTVRPLPVDSPVVPVSAHLNYAAQGRLARMIRSGGKEASGYALQNSHGKVEAVVVAAPGVNLERYLKENVGIQGRRKPHPSWKLPVVYAERVILLDRHDPAPSSDLD
jgi:hypothetical protein